VPNTKTTLSLEHTYLHLRPDNSAKAVNVTSDFWSALGSGKRPELDAGRLMLQFDGTEDWSTWERHPEGEEVVLLVAGEATLVLEAPRGVVLHHLKRPGDFVLVPRNVWHTAKVKNFCTLLFVTPGKGTETKPVHS
jgi:mannose-6-phosphate isomerase-like protein (cupin superfamily)